MGEKLCSTVAFTYGSEYCGIRTVICIGGNADCKLAHGSRLLGAFIYAFVSKECNEHINLQIIRQLPAFRRFTTRQIRCIIGKKQAVYTNANL